MLTGVALCHLDSYCSVNILPPGIRGPGFSRLQPQYFSFIHATVLCHLSATSSTPYYWSLLYSSHFSSYWFFWLWGPGFSRLPVAKLFSHLFVHSNYCFHLALFTLSFIASSLSHIFNLFTLHSLVIPDFTQLSQECLHISVNFSFIFLLSK